MKQHTEQSKSRVSCKGCSHTFAGKTTRMAAHYMQTAGESVSLCKSPPEGATDAATAHFSALEKKRVEHGTSFIVKKTKHACMGRVQAFRTPWSRRRCPARRGCVCSREKLTMLRWYFIQCIKPACSCSNKVCCTSKGATAKKKNDVVCTNIRI